MEPNAPDEPILSSATPCKSPDSEGPPAPRKIRTKWLCEGRSERLRSPDSHIWDFHFRVVTAGSPENQAFFKATPSGNMTLSAVKEDAYRVGQAYYFDSSEAN